MQRICPALLPLCTLAHQYKVERGVIPPRAKRPLRVRTCAKSLRRPSGQVEEVSRSVSHLLWEKLGNAQVAKRVHELPARQ